MLRHDFLKERKSTVLLPILSKKFLTDYRRERENGEFSLSLKTNTGFYSTAIKIRKIYKCTFCPGTAANNSFV